MASIGVHGGAAGAASAGLTDAELRAVAVPVSVAGGATAALQTAGNDDLDTIVSATVATSNAVTSLAEALGVPGAFLGLATQPVSATDLDVRNLAFATDKIDASGSTGVGVTGTFWQATQPVSGTVTATTAKPSTAAQSSPSVLTTNTSILAANANRLGATLFNESGATAFVKLGATASLTSYSIAIPIGAYYEVPFGYTGAIDGITVAITAVFRVTELTA